MPVSVIIPTADAQSDWTPSAGGDNFAMVDEDNFDSDSTYNSTSTQNNRDLFTGADLSIPSDATINEVLIKMYARKVPAQETKMGFSSKHDSTTNHTSFVLTTSYVLYEEDITSAESWQPSDFDGAGRLEVGYFHAQSQAREARVTMLWAEVRWTPMEPTENPNTSVDDSTVGTKAWTSPTQVQGSDGTYSTIGLFFNELSHYIKATNFGFTVGQVPTGSTINGIEVHLETREDDTDSVIVDQDVKIVKGGTIGATDRASFTELNQREASITLGSPTDLWGETWTPADIRNSGFGVAVAYKQTFASGGDTKFDSITITIYLTADGNGQRIRQIMVMD